MSVLRRTVCVSVWLPRDLRAALLKLAGKKGVTLSKVIVWALTAYLDREE